MQTRQTYETRKRPIDWVTIGELSELTGIAAKSFYNAHSARRGPFAAILTKLGGRLGCWRADYDALKTAQRRLPSSAESATIAQPAPTAATRGTERRTVVSKARRSSRK